MSSKKKAATATRLAHGGRKREGQFGAINPPIVRASTILFDTYQDFLTRKTRNRHRGEFTYGRNANPSAVALEGLVAELEGAADCFSVQNGLAAVSGALLAMLGSGDHLLIADTVYEPSRNVARLALTRLGVEVEFYDPLIGAGIETLFRPNTRAIFMESPGSLTFEVQDVPAIAAAARQHDIVTMIDNSWASPLGFQPLAHGVDISIHAATKHIVGHSDAMLGLIAVNERCETRLRTGIWGLGYGAGSEEAYLGLRGMRTIELRLKQASANALVVARWLQQRPEVERVLYPPLPDDPGHALWKRDFTGACGLFGVVLAAPQTDDALSAMIDGYDYFGLGASWGGYESLVIPTFPEKLRTARPWHAKGSTLRYHVGLEDPEDLIGDLEAGFARLAGAQA